MFIAKTAFPIAFRSPVHEALFSQAVSSPFTLFSCLPGYLAKDALVYALASQERSIMWLRLGREDRDPGTLLLSLIQSARQVQPGIGGIALEKMKLNPGSLMGWPALYNLLAQELADGLPPSSAIVLENAHHLATVIPTLKLLNDHLLAQLPNSLSRILTTYWDLPSSVFSLPFRCYTARDLRIDFPDGLTLAKTYRADLPKECLRKALQLIDGRDLVLTGLLAMCQELGLGLLQSVILNSKKADQLLTQLVHASLVEASEDEIGSLILTLFLDYCHPELSRVSLGKPAIPHGPCVQSLSDGWLRLLHTWRDPLQAAFRSEHRVMKVANLNSLAEYLAHQGAVENAVELCIVQKSYAVAARLMANAVEKMMDLGQWITLEGWLQQLPEDVIHEWPRLVYTQGEIAATHGYIAEARRIFAVSSKLFSDKGDPEEMCQSMLAESTLAAWEGDRSQAQHFAQSASALAHEASLTNKKVDINWQLACLATASDKLDEALAYLASVSETSTDPFLAELCHNANRLLKHQLALQAQCRSQYQSYLETVQAKQGNLVLLKQLLNSPVPNLSEVLARRGWSNTPLMLKIAAPSQLPEFLEAKQKPNFLKRLRQVLFINQWGNVSAGYGGSINQISESNGSLEILTQPQLESIQPPQILLPTRSEKIALLDLSAEPEKPVAEVVSAYMLGEFRLEINNKAVQEWGSGRGLSILKYLLAHHQHAVPRDILMDVFWPESDPEAARNNLNVAVHALRRTLRTVTELQTVVFVDGRYALNPDINTWIDIEEFECHLRAGLQMASADQATLAVPEFEMAVSLYQGDFLEGDLYEQWTQVPRERLRFALMDLLDWLSNIYFTQGQYAPCAALCQRILEIDNCREDAHRRLMHCFTRQGQINLALRQYSLCKEILWKELQVEPETKTTELAEQIRLHKPV